ncbi:COFACTOR ASSEMBLY OF COMPLEX C SUBUNIT B CCB3 [Spatholobus suberectus]|nr:COFACTOR ASSEMBLY OF COMPLEX C SUBUNIT B CCB3 [Spatholobus suberectus]
MATQSYLLNLNTLHVLAGIRGRQCKPSIFKPSNFGLGVWKSSKYPTTRNVNGNSRVMQCCSYYTEVGASAGITKFSLLAAATTEISLNSDGDLNTLKLSIPEASHASTDFLKRLVLADLDPATAKLAIGFLGPFLSVFGFLFILRIVMSWYPKLPVGKFPYVIAYAPTEPLLIPTRKVIPPLAGVDVTPVVWFGLISFLNEILVGPQGLLVLLSQQVN